MKQLLIFLLLIPFVSSFAQHQHGHPTKNMQEAMGALKPGAKVVYHLYIQDTLANMSGKKEVRALAINGQIPAPTLRFTEGDTAVIYVHNLMKHETSIHWHGLLLPNKEDGVPYLTTAPIAAGGEHMFTFPLIQSGTYWYHSHTMLQEQSGLYGSIVIQPREKLFATDKDFVLLLSDWTDERPSRVLNTLKRSDAASEWYSVKKGYAQSLDKLILHKGLGSRLRNGWKRMPPMDISDVYYDAFLVNGKRKESIKDLKPGEKIRLRVINGSSSTYFYLHGPDLTLISSDGVDVQPIKVDRLLMGIAETYDFILTVPQNRTLEFRATAQDISGFTSLYYGEGDTLSAPPIPRPNVWKMEELMKDLVVNFPNRMSHSMKGDMKMEANKNSSQDMNMMPAKMEMEGQEHHPEMKHNGHADSTEQAVIFNYDLLRARAATSFDVSKPVQTYHLKLTGSMFRYIWSINNKVLSQADKIHIKKGEVVRFELENTTMMNHPMHLHGHYFRVINQQGDFSPLKHTVDVPPGTSVTIEFLASEEKDWFFHCHVLYHMMSGMARIVSYEGSDRDSSLADYPISELLKEDKKWFFYGSVAAKSQMAESKLNFINRGNAVRFEGNYNYGSQYEANLSYERYIGDWLRPYIGFGVLKQRYFNIFNGEQTFEQEFNLPVVGLRYTLPFFIEADLRVNSKGRVRFALEGEEWLLPKLFFNWRLNTDKEYHLDLEYMISKKISIAGGYDSRYKLGAGLLLRL